MLLTILQQYWSIFVSGLLILAVSVYWLIQIILLKKKEKQIKHEELMLKRRAIILKNNNRKLSK